MRQKIYDTLGSIIVFLWVIQFPTFANNPPANWNEDNADTFYPLIASDTLDNPSACLLGLPILDDDCSSIQEFGIEVINPPGDSLGVNVYLKEVRLIIGHEWDLDLDLFLISPSGEVVTLSTDNGDTGDNYGDPTDINCGNYTTFLSHTSPEACNALNVEDGVAPFNGHFLPEGSFSEFNDGKTNPEGIWHLKICDDAAANEGTLEFVELVFEPLVCIPPSQIEILAVDSTSVLLDWVPGNFCGNTIIEYGTNLGFMPGLGVMVGGGDAAPATVCPPVLIDNLNPNTSYEFYIREFCGGNQYSDNSCPITLSTSCSPRLSTLVENFDNQSLCEPTCGFACPINGTWRNSMIDAFDWTVHKGETISSLTGPSDDALSGGNYIYLEASGPECQNEMAYLVSNCIQINASSDTCDMSFFYHMYGFHIGKLSLEITTDGGINWQELWSAQGDQGNDWLFKYIDLSLYNGQIVQFRFSGEMGNNFRGDMALDQIAFYGSQDLGPGSLTYYVDKDGDGYGDSNMFFRTCWQISIPGFSELGGDCDDDIPFVNPGMEETPCDGWDINCNGDADEFFLLAPFVNPDFDTINICSGELAMIEASPQLFGEIYWFDTEMGGNTLHVGETYSPVNLPLNNSPSPVFYNFYAEERNSFGCLSEVRAKVTIAVFPNPEISTTDEVFICAGELFDLADLNIIDATQSSAAYTYYRGAISQNNLLGSSLVNPLSSTTYTIVGETSIGCKDTLEVIINVKPSPQPFIFGDPTICRATSTSLNAVEIGNGSPPLSYKWNTGSITKNTIAYSGAVIDEEQTYVVSLTDSDGCVGIDSFTVTTIGSIESVTTSSADVTDCNGADGVINIAILGGEAPFEYQWSGPASSNGSGGSNSTSFSIFGLAQGSYSITITDSADEICPFIINNAVVNGPSVIITEPNLTEPRCFGSSDGKIFLDIIGNDYTLFWNTGDTTELITDLIAGFYEATVIAGGCITKIPINLTQPPQLAVSPIVQDVQCPNGSDGEIKLAVFGGTPSYFYKWDNGAFIDSLNNLGAGTYTVSVTDLFGCETILPIEVKSSDPIEIDTINYHAVSCFGGRDGNIEISVSGGNPTYSYIWSNGNLTTQASFLEVGEYSITVTDDNGCTYSESFEMVQPNPIQIDIVGTQDATCIGIDDGQAEIFVTGGTPGYLYDWNNNSSDPNPTNFAPGEFWVQVTDANSCTGISDTITIVSPAKLDFEKEVTMPFCPGINNGEIIIDTNTITGGSQPFSFQWLGNNTGSTLENLSSGTYTVTITDGAGCLFIDTTLLEAGQPIDIQVDMIDPACFETNTGSINISAFGGIPPYSIDWNFDSDDFSVVMLNEGNYWATITDNVGCFLISDSLILEDPSALLLGMESLEDNVCSGGQEGSIDIAPVGGTAPYNYAWSNGSVNQDISNLGSGNYTITLTDNNSCPFIKTFNITDPPPIQLETSIINIPKCDLDPIDSVCIIPNGGLEPYQFFWSTGDTTNCLVQVPTGEYSVTVSDEMGCSEVMESVKYPDPIEPISVEILMDQSQLIQCFDAKDGVLTVNFIGGTSPYEYNWNHGLVGNTDTDTLTINGLESGLCSVTVVDANECMAVSDTWQVGQANLLTALIEDVSHVKCFDGSDGSIDIDVTGGTAPYSYGWLNELGDTLNSAQNIDSLSTGSYSFFVTDSINCSFEVNEIEIIEPEQALTILNNPPEVNHISCFGESDGSIKLKPSGGVPPYEYDWSNGGLTDSLANLSVGEYSITITDANLCLLSSELIIEGPDTSIYLLDEVVNDISCFGEEDGSILLMVGGGWGNFTFRWNDPMLTNTLDLVDVTAGSYTIEIEDEGDCIFKKEYMIIEPSEITVGISTTPQTASNFGTAEIITSGGIGPYTFTWSSGQDSSFVEDLEEGTYLVTVTDINGCFIIEEVEIDFANIVKDEEILGLKLYPNPTNGVFFLEIELLNSKDIDIQVLDIFGRPILQKTEVNIQKTQMVFNLEKEPSGVFLIQIRDKGRLIYSDRVVKE